MVTTAKGFLILDSRVQQGYMNRYSLILKSNMQWQCRMLFGTLRIVPLVRTAQGSLLLDNVGRLSYLALTFTDFQIQKPSREPP